MKANSSIIANPNKDKPKTESYAIGFLLIPYNNPVKIKPIPRAQPAKGKIQTAAAKIFIPVRKTI